MRRCRWVVLALLAFASPSAFADIVCPDSSYVTVTLGPTGKDRLTIVPGGVSSETWSSLGVVIRVYLKNCSGTPLAGVPREEIVMFNPALCLCPGGNIADAATDVNGSTSFSGTLSGGGCAENLMVFADGILLATTALKTNSTDLFPVSPCFVDAGDLAAVAGRLGCPGPNCAGSYTICADWNEDGIIDASELAYMAAQLGVSCP